MSAKRKRHPMDATPRKLAERVMIPVIRVTNPFDPREHVREEMTWVSNRTLADYFPLGTAELVVSVNGKIVPREQFGVTYLDKTDNMVLCPVPTGGGSGKQILSLVAIIAVAVFAPYAAAAMNGVMGMTTVTAAGALTTTGMMVAAGVAVAGSMLVNALFAPPKPSAKAAEAATSSYGVDGAKNTALEGIPVPVCYGQFRMAGNILSLHVDNDADDNQILYMLLSAGEGPVASLTDIEVNDNPVSDYKDVEVQTRTGQANQTVIPWFSENMVAINKSQKLTTDWFPSTTTTVVDKIRLDFIAPQGLCTVSTKDGSTGSASVTVEIEYRKEGESTWQKLPVTNTVSGWDSVTGEYPSGVQIDSRTGRPYSIDGDGTITYLDIQPTTWRDQSGGVVTDPLQQDYLATNAVVPEPDDDGNWRPTNRAPRYSQSTTISAAKRSAVRRSFVTGQLDPAKYEVRVRRTTAKSTENNVLDEMYLADVNEITVDTVTYPHTALVALKIRLTDQISGLPRVTFLNGGRMIAVYGKPLESSTTEQWYLDNSQNPAWIVWDMLTHRRYGGAMPTSRLDFHAFNEWAAYCDAKNLKWNGPIEQEMNVWDASQLVLRVGHSQLVNVGTRYTVVTEKPSTPVMMFSVANMIEGSYKETWLGINDRANEIDVTFFDKGDDYKQRTVKIYDPAAITAGQKQRTSAITLYGVTDYETAYKEGQFQLNLNRYILKTISFSAPLEAVACSVGDLIYVQHDMTEWAVAGRTESASTTSLVKLDRQIEMVAGEQYKLLLLRDAVQRAAGSILSVVGTSLLLTNFDGEMPVKRIKINARDLRVAAIFNQGGGAYGVIVEDDLTGIAPGQAYTLWDTDVVEEHNVLNQPGTRTDVTLQAPMSSAPGQYVNWMFGATDKVKQPFRVRSVSGSHEYTRDIMALEYREEVYDFDRYGSNVPVIPPKDGVIGPVRDLSVYEETYVVPSGIVSEVVASWAVPLTGMYAGADVYVQKNGGPVEKLVDAKSRNSAVIPANKGDVLAVRVVAYDLFGKRSQYELAPVATYTVLGEVPGIDVGDVTGSGFVWSGRDCKINWRYNSVTHAYEFGSEPGPLGGDAGSLDPQFKDYEIRVYDRTHTILRRTEYTTDNSYTYIYDKNFADGLARYLVFEVRQRDKFNNLGKPAVLEAYNPPPQVTGVSSKATFESATVAYTHNADPDFAGARIWLSETASDLTGLPPDDKIVYQGPDSAVLLPGLFFNRDYFFKIATYDAFGPTELVPSATMTFKTTHLNVDAIADGVLSDSVLIPELRDRIDLIDAPATVVGSVSARILAEAVARGTAITQTQTLITQGDAQVASTVTALSAVVGNNAAAITNEATARANADTALSNTMSAWAAQIASNSAAIANETIARATAIAAEASQRNEQFVTYDGTIRSWVQTYSYSKATADATTNQVYSTLRSEYNAAANGAYSSAQSYVQSYAYTKAQTNSAIATSTNQVTSRLDNIGGVTLEQKFVTQADTNSGLLGQYTVKVDNNGYVSGFGLASTSKNGVPTSEFIINADKFAVITSAGNEHPFTIGLVNGVTRTIIKSVLIGDASINTAKIGDAQVNTLKIGANSVTVPSTLSASSAYPGSGVGNYTNMLDMTINMPSSGYIYAHSVFQQQYGSGIRGWQAVLQIDGVSVFAAGGVSVADTVSLAGSRFVGAGNHTISLLWSGENSGITINNRTLFAMAAMR